MSQTKVQSIKKYSKLRIIGNSQARFEAKQTKGFHLILRHFFSLRHFFPHLSRLFALVFSCSTFLYSSFNKSGETFIINYDGMSGKMSRYFEKFLGLISQLCVLNLCHILTRRWPRISRVSGSSPGAGDFSLQQWIAVLQ